MPIWDFSDWADIKDNAKRIVPRINDKVSISVDKKFLYINGIAMPTGVGATGMILQSNGLSQLSWVDPGQLGSQPSYTGTTYGATGLPGAMGVTGIQGATGLRGTSGTSGATGLRGSTGPQGATGVKGNVGSQGVTGPQGTLGNGLTGCLNCTVDGRGYPITVGYKGDIVIPAKIKVFRWDLFGNTGGSVMLNVKKATYSSYPGDTTMHLGATGPSLTLSTKNQNTNLSGWLSPTGAAGDILRIEVVSCTGIHRLSLNVGYSLI